MMKVNIKKRFDDFTLDRQWQVEKSEVAALFGPSGSGKSLTIKAIAGLVVPDEGYIEIDSKFIFHKDKNICIPSKDRCVGYVPQNYGLFPHMKVSDNIMFAMKENDKNNKKKKMLDLLSRVGLTHKKDKYPSQLSGGEKQRIAILRALAINPKALLLDEPFSSVDIPLRKVLRQEIKDFLMQLNIPVVLVTHDPADIEALATKVVCYG